MREADAYGSTLGGFAGSVWESGLPPSKDK
jgi:hypothetical protein